MKQIPVKFLRVGLVFTEPVYIEGDNLLVPSGVAIREKDIYRLNSWGIETVETNGRPIIDKNKSPSPSLGGKTGIGGKGESALWGKENAKIPRDMGKKAAPNGLLVGGVLEDTWAFRNYLNLIDGVDGVLSDVASQTTIDTHTIDFIVDRLFQDVRRDRVFINFILLDDLNSRGMARAAVDSAILSVLLAIEMKLPSHKVMQIVTAALLHDAGMLRLPPELLKKKGELTQEEFKLLQTHPYHAVKLVTRELLCPKDVAFIILQHHERWDGKGYPRQIPGESIDLGARILSLADAFVSLLGGKPIRNSFTASEVLRTILSENGRRFDPGTLKPFFKIMAIYPVGSLVILNNGTVGRVTTFHASAPLRPKIQILITESGKKLKSGEEERFFDLTMDPHLYVARLMDPKEVGL